MTPPTTPTLNKKRSFGSWIKRVASGGNGGYNTRKIGPVSSNNKKSKGVYGVPLCESVCYARSTVGYVDEEAIKHRRAGIIPLVVAKCGSFLKAHGLQTEGIFRISGNTRRVNILQALFDNPKESYGLNLNWLGYTIHDASTALRRYLNKLPEPVIPHAFYKDFRNVMSDKHYHSTEERIEAFQHLIQLLPLSHQHLLLYLLDMLSLFASNSAETKMDAANLAIVFSPGILSHPNHRSPVQYRISQRVLEFLIEFQALFTMQLLSSQQVSTTLQLKRSKNIANGGAGGSNGSVVPPVPPLPKNAFVDPRATKSDPLLPLSPQPVRPIPRQLFADVPMDEKTQEKDDTKHVNSLQLSIKQQQQQREAAVIVPSSLTRPRSATESLASPTTTFQQPTTLDHHHPQQYEATDEEDNEDDDASTPRAMSPVQSPSPRLTEEQLPPLPSKNIIEELQSIRDTILHKLPDKSIGYVAWIIVANIVIVVLLYELYQAIWGMCCFEPYIFFMGFILYWGLLLHGIQWNGKIEPKYERYRGGWLLGGEKEEDPTKDDDDYEEYEDENDGLSLFDDISIAQQDEEEAMLRDTMCEWHSLLSRSWREQQEESQEDHSDKMSIMSTSSRFNEEEYLKREERAGAYDSYDDDDDDDVTTGSSLPDIDLQALWERHQQILQDERLATKIQENEKMQYRRRSQSNSNVNHREEWKIRRYNQ
ncbi:Rho GTPase activation protein [Phascolomyces articulosus]|uniref:Rho GTPase activation protein n=1 Tax=Phascolomyces articulosus TaxID=60185 RepID=A0AAD5PAF4_9FUNG|nr:Rho GTPase activation protein [Phascolomyces articulosus]